MTDQASVQAWFATWGGYVAAHDFDGARALFHPHVTGFGTFKDFVQGLDALEAGQWRSIWPTIADFKFRVEELELQISPDRLFASAAVLWTSTGFDSEKQPYDRPGRATVAIDRATVDSPWLGLHTHFSQFPAERKLSFG